MGKYPSCTVVLKPEHVHVEPEKELGSEQSCHVKVENNTVKVQYCENGCGETILLRGECFWDHVTSYLEISLEELKERKTMELLRDCLRLNAFNTSKDNILEFRLHFQNAKICSGYVEKDMVIKED